VTKELLNYKDPEKGESIFGVIGLNKFGLVDLKKAIDLAYDNGEKNIKDIISLVMHKPY
jgi:hypothetical protein